MRIQRIAVIVAIVGFGLLAFPRALHASESVPPAQQLMSKLEWRNIGPYIGGRVVAVAGVPNNPDLFYMGAVQGGIWKSTNYGQSWENMSDGKIPGEADSIGALAVAVSNPRIIYAGTGENDIRQDFDTGDGIYKSTDAGTTWQYAGLRETHMISSLAIDPHDPNIVYATSMGHVFMPNAERGVFKSTDGGKTWNKILYVDENTGASVVVMNPRDSRVLYAAMWQAQRRPWGLTSGGPGSGLYKTTDGGAHWTNISSHPGFARGPLGKIGVSVSAANQSIVYAIVQAREGGVFRSDDGGATWKRVNAEWKLRQRAFYYMAIYADPANVNIAYVPQVDGVFKTTDGGKKWKAISPSGDHHIIWINPHDPKILLLGNDGGASVSVDGGKTWSTENNQPTGQYYHVALDHQFPFHVYGAQQDEGAYEGPSASHEGLTNGLWHNVAGGESTFIAPRPDDPLVTYGSGYYTYLARQDRTTGEAKDVSNWPKYVSGASASEMKYRFGWTHPIFFSPVKSNELFVASQYVLVSDDYGQTWRRISPDLTRNDKSTEGPSGGPVDLDETGAETYPDISALAVSPLAADVIWAGSADGLAHVTTDGGALWRLITPPQLPQWSEITSIEPSRTDRATAYLTASRYQSDDFHPYVYKTVDSGAHWTAITSGLPDDQYVFVVRQDPREPRVLFAGTRSTAYVSLNGGEQWQPLTLNLPGVQVRDIAIDARQGDVVAATHGRAFWILDNLKLLEQLAQQSELSVAGVKLFSPGTAWLSHAYGGSVSPDSDSGENPKYGATVFFNIPSDYNGNVPVTISFRDAQGKLVRSFTLHVSDKNTKKVSDEEISSWDHVRQLAYDLRESTAIDPGMNAFQWDMRYAPATEVKGYHIPTTDDIDDGVSGPTIVPGTYSVALDYGGKQVEQSFRVELDPRLHPAPGALAARLALALRVEDSLDTLNRAINAAMVRRDGINGAQRSRLDRELSRLVQINIQSSEGDSLHEVKLRDYLGFLLNELDMAYQQPTAAEYATYNELRADAGAALADLRELSVSSASNAANTRLTAPTR